MTDAHFHRHGMETFLAQGETVYRFAGVHPWQADAGVSVESLAAHLAADRHLGVGETGLDRLRARLVSEAQRAAFAHQLDLAADFARPVVLHGAKCWGEVVKACQPFAGRIPAFLFHGFSRSEGLVPDIVRLNGFISLGPALLNDHAVNYRAMARRLPAECLLVETDLDEGDDPAARWAVVDTVLEKLASLRGEERPALEARIAENAARLVEALS